jgi:hypothetical protein
VAACQYRSIQATSWALIFKPVGQSPILDVDIQLPLELEAAAFAAERLRSGTRER